MFDFILSFSGIVNTMSNFLFLKNTSLNLFSIIAEAEKLFRDEYFEQSIIQVRRFSENVCRDLLGDKVSSEDSFDSLINKIKDNSFGNTRMTELYDDLYFIKKQGNRSVHASSVKNDGKVALECLERAYEISVFYSNIKFGYDKKLDKSVFSEELLMTGQQKSSGNLKIIYSDKLTTVRKSANSKKTIEYPTRKKSTKSLDSNKSNKSLFSNIFNSIGSLIIFFLTVAYLYSCIKK